MNSDEIKIVFSAVDNISTIAEKIAGAFTSINKSSALTAQQGLQQVNNALGDKLNRSLRLSTERTQQFLASMDQMPKKVQQAAASMVNVTNGNMKLSTSFRDMAQAPVQIQKALEGVMTQSERSRLALYRFGQELKTLGASGSVSVSALQTKFNQLMANSGLTVDHQRKLWSEFFLSLPSEQKKASDLQIRDLQRLENERQQSLRRIQADQQRADRQTEQDIQRQTRLQQQELQRRTRLQQQQMRQTERDLQQQARLRQQMLDRQVKAEEKAARDSAQASRHRFAMGVNLARIGLQSAMLGSQVASGFSQGFGGGFGAFANAAFLARPLMMAGPTGLALAGGVAALSVALTGLTKVLESSANAAKAAAQNFMQMEAVASLRNLPAGVPQQQQQLGAQLSRKYGFKLPEVQNANLQLLESGLFGPDALNTAAMIAKAENKPIEEVAKDLSDLIQSGQTESFTQKYRITSARVIGLRKPSLSAAYGSSKDFFQDVQKKLGPTVGQIVEQQPGERIGASIESIQTTIGSPVWQAFLRILQPISELIDKIATDIEGMFKDQKFLDEMSAAFDEIGAAMKDAAPIMGEFAKTFARFLVEGIKDFVKALPTIIRLMEPLLALFTVMMKLALILIEVFKKLLHAMEPILPVLKALWEGWKAWTATLLVFMDIVYDLLNGTKSLSDVLASLGLHLKDIGANGPGANDAIKHLGDLLRSAADLARDLLGLLARLQGPWNIVVTVTMPEIQLPTLPNIQVGVDFNIPEIHLPTLPDLQVNVVFQMPDIGTMIRLQFETVTGEVQEIWNGMWAALISEAEADTGKVNEAIQSIVQSATNLKTTLVAAWNEVTDAILAVPRMIEQAWTGVEQTVEGGIRSMGEKISAFVTQVGETIQNTPVVGGIVKFLTSDIQTRVQMIGEAGKDVATGIVNSPYGQQQLAVAGGAVAVATGVREAVSGAPRPPVFGLPPMTPGPRQPGENPRYPAQGQGLVNAGATADFPFGIGFSAGSPNIPNPFDKNKKKNDQNYNPDTSMESYDVAPTQVQGPGAPSDTGYTSGPTTINVYIQGGDFSDSAAIKNRAREVGDQIGFNLRGRGGIQIP